MQAKYNSKALIFRLDFRKKKACFTDFFRFVFSVSFSYYLFILNVDFIDQSLHQSTITVVSHAKIIKEMVISLHLGVLSALFSSLEELHQKTLNVFILTNSFFI